MVVSQADRSGWVRSRRSSRPQRGQRIASSLANNGRTAKNDRYAVNYSPAAGQLQTPDLFRSRRALQTGKAVHRESIEAEHHKPDWRSERPLVNLKSAVNSKLPPIQIERNPEDTVTHLRRSPAATASDQASYRVDLMETFPVSSVQYNSELSI
jgi:hypothetical protein